MIKVFTIVALILSAVFIAVFFIYKQWFQKQNSKIVETPSEPVSSEASKTHETIPGQNRNDDVIKKDSLVEPESAGVLPSFEEVTIECEIEYHKTESTDHEIITPASLTVLKTELDIFVSTSETTEVEKDNGHSENTVYKYSASIHESIYEKTTNPKAMDTNEMTDSSTSHLPVEFQYLQSLIRYRMSGGDEPELPSIDSWQNSIAAFLIEYGLQYDKDAAIILLIALAPHAYPDLFDDAFDDKISGTNFPEIGGVHGKNYRGFLPTGQTASYLIAGDDWERRRAVEQLFWSEFTFSKKKILWLEELPQGEPLLSGKIILALDYADRILFGASAPPHFSVNFPAKKIETSLTSADIVMSKEMQEGFAEMKSWLLYNDELLGKWNMKERLREGYRILFYGPPGTGKTITAKVLGKETGKTVYKIDLSMVVSKYIGETEKNLELLFARAEDKDWILFFDEADSLFGKRTNVKDAHDKYANQEVSYLLQRLEDYNGLVILATNMKNNIDEAFTRRFNSILKFSFPDATQRVLIWRKLLPRNSVFRSRLMPDESVNIFESVKKYELSGGNIINIVHYAGIKAVQALHSQTENPEVEEVGCEDVIVRSKPYYNNCEPKDTLVIYIEDVLEGIKRELIKEGKPFS